MRRLALALLMLTITTGMVCAQEPSFRFEGNVLEEEDSARRTADQATNEEISSASDEYRATLEMADVKSLVQRNAMFRADQRRRRLAARRWFGLSNSRPVAASVPYMTPYSPAWAGNPWMPYSWYGTYWR